MPRLSKIGAAALAAFGWTSGSSVTASYLVVAGGGAGGNGGGGAGGYQTGTTSLNPTLSYTVAVGAGGANATYPTVGSSGGASSISSIGISSAGGGAAAQAGNAGLSGGSGGGGAGSSFGSGAAGSGNTPSTSPSQGNNGGTAGTGTTGSSGGGGASAVGGNGSGGTGGAGGAGTASSISGSSVTYSGGGGAGGDTAGAGGSGGGGAGASGNNNGTSGTSNTGGGGGGTRNNTIIATAGNGGSGVVIISYVGAQQFGGGNVTSDGTNTIHTFTTSGTLSPLSTPLTTNFLVVAGGGAGAGGVGGGGGAGGFRTSAGTSGGGGSAETALTLDTNTIYTVTVGAGGTAGGTESTPGTNGGNSSISSITSTGGGCGGSAAAGTNGQTGGSGGGQGGSTSSAGSGTANQGYGGGTTSTGGTNTYTGGGGGAGAVGGSYTAGTASGAGGAGVSSSISGSAVTYGGGGGGGRYGAAVSGGAGGAGGGGAGCGGSATTRADGSAGTANTGGAGGGGSGNGGLGGAGGSGVVIISYAGTQQFGGGVVTFSGGNTIHTFTSSGYLSPIKTVNRSLRFRNSASAYLNRTFNTPTNNKIFTYSTWVKIGSGTTGYPALLCCPSTTDELIFNLTGGNGTIEYYNNAAVSSNIKTNAIYRDPAAWYHIMVATDTTQATASNRVKLYVNGVQVTSFNTATYPAQNYSQGFNSAVSQQIGKATGSQYFDGYLTEINFIDGQQLTPSSFGAFNSYGVWQPIAYGGSYGNNGFYLTFGNNTSTTTLGYDTSPQGNNWTTNNISVTAGATYDSMLDVPTLTSATAANYAVMNPLFAGTSSYLSGGNLNASISAANTSVVGTFQIPSSGQWYWEYQVTTIAGGGAPMGGIATTASNSPAVFYRTDGTKIVDGTNTSYGATYTTTDTIGVAVDVGGGTITFYKNNTSQGAITYASSAFYPALRSNAATDVFNINFGQRPFTYTPPSGFVALNTFNLSTPTIPNGAVYMATTTYTGTGATQVVTNTVNGTAMQPDWVWLKSRSAARDHRLMDTNRGINNILYSDLTIAESAGSALSSVNSNGFTLNTTDNQNVSSETYIGWQWKANAGTNVSNTSGTITSTVSANTTAGFSVVIWTGGGSAGTIGHGLGVTPGMIIIKNRSGTQFWFVNHTSISTTQNLYLNDTAAVQSDGIFTSRGATTFGVGTGVAGSATNYVAYVFAAVAGYSAFGSYTGNGSTDGPFVYLGFRPRFIMVKCSSNSTGSTVWTMWDTSRSPYNASVNELYANLNSVESVDASGIDILSNGFKPKRNSEYANTSGWTYIYMAFAENPFKYSNAR